MAFDWYKRPIVRAPEVQIKRFDIILTAAGLAVVGDTQRVQVGVDKHSNMIALRPTADTDDSFEIVKTGEIGTISAKPFFDTYKISAGAKAKGGTLDKVSDMYVFSYVPATPRKGASAGTPKGDSTQVTPDPKKTRTKWKAGDAIPSRGRKSLEQQAQIDALAKGMSLPEYVASLK